MEKCNEEPDIPALVFQATLQIPKGRVSTYGAIAAALGDPVAARAVGEILSSNPTPIVVPCHRVVYSDGRSGWYNGHGQGAERKVELLRSEGVEVEHGMVENFADIKFTDFDIPPILQDLKREQEAVRRSVIDKDDFGQIEMVAGLDISYEGNRAFAALTVFDWSSGKLIEERTEESVIKFPYIPTYLSYREIPALRPLISSDEDIIFLIDGQGILHPRGAGIASQIGVCLDVATIGAAKSSLIGTTQGDGDGPVLVDGKVRGYRMVQGKKECYVSTGHRVSLDTAISICRRFLDRGIPLPLRRAHELANETRRAAK
jgi:deoxyribonuclease V